MTTRWIRHSKRYRGRKEKNFQSFCLEPKWRSGTMTNDDINADHVYDNVNSASYIIIDFHTTVTKLKVMNYIATIGM